MAAIGEGEGEGHAVYGAPQMMPEAGSGHCRSDLGILDLGALEKAELKDREQLDRVSLGNDFPMRGRKRMGPGACGSGGGEEWDLGWSLDWFPA